VENQNPPRQSFVDKLYPFFDRIEKILVFLVLAGFILPYAGMKTLDLITAAMSGLAGIYFLKAYQPLTFEREQGEKAGFKNLLMQTVAPKMVWIGCAVSVIGILFYILGAKGYVQMISVGGSVLLACSLILVFFLANNSRDLKVYTPILFRMIPLLLLDGYIYQFSGGIIWPR
jgi:hypothetical protein